LGDPNHRVLTSNPEKSLLWFLQHLDRELLSIGDPQLGHRRFDGEVDRPRPHL
jgi:hypothetical protein